jgi:hypothetical protein
MSVIAYDEMQPQDQQSLRALVLELLAATSDDDKRAKKQEIFSAWKAINERENTDAKTR